MTECMATVALMYITLYAIILFIIILQVQQAPYIPAIWLDSWTTFILPSTFASGKQLTNSDLIASLLIWSIIQAKPHE